MYGREEASKLRQQFWITFGKYMKPIPSSTGLPVNWVNYKTGVKYVFFKMNADQHQATIAIELTHPDAETRHFYFEKFEQMKALLTTAVGEEWIWTADAVNEFGQPLSRISKTLDHSSIFNQNQWPALISFLKPRIIGLDEFWNDAKPFFE